MRRPSAFVANLIVEANEMIDDEAAIGYMSAWLEQLKARIEPGAFGDGFVVRNQHAPLACGDGFVGIKAEAGDIADTTDEAAFLIRFSSINGGKGVGRIFHHLKL